MKQYQAIRILGYCRNTNSEPDPNTTITEVTDDRVKGVRYNKSFDVKRNGEKFSVGSGSGKIRFNLRAM